MAGLRKVTRQARRLQNQGVSRGKAWAPIIHRLGFDPRTFLNGTLTLSSNPQGQLQRGQGTLKPFTPYKAPTKPPPGTYDPSLDAEERAADRGYLDLQQDTEQQGARAFSDMFDPALGAIPNLARQRAEEGVDYGNQIGGLRRSFQRLGTGQTNAARAAGVDEGGALIQALRKRAENETVARQPIDLAHTRFGEENTRLVSKANLDYQRGGEDRATTLGRAGREKDFFHQDVGAQRFFQAEQSGADLPSKPANERTKAGVTFRVGGARKPLAQRTYRLAGGQTLGRGAFVRMMRKRRGQA